MLILPELLVVGKKSGDAHLSHLLDQKSELALGEYALPSGIYPLECLDEIGE